MSKLEKELSLAFKEQNSYYLRKLHLYLNHQYYNLFLNRDHNHLLEPNDWAYFKSIETTWMAHEINDCLNRYHCAEKIEEGDAIKQVVKNHYVYQHPLFNYLEHDATFSDFKYFFENDSVLNIEFFDYLALSLPATNDKAKKEIMGVLWNECGRGSSSYYTANQFFALLNVFNIDYERDKLIQKMSWEGLAGMNLINYLSQYGFNKMKYFGLITATQILDVAHYTKMSNGLKRLFYQQPANINYLLKHEHLVKQNNHHWIRKVVLPELSQRPHHTIEFWVGFYLRLDSMQRFYDSLYFALINKKVA